ncbi:exported hypothetical protein [Candidatus Sulfopaludibacter sp. SbA4]|nr:exported hypothetical protein [Candidatus Sulfopaludibacter sp. SbA4]
MTTLPKLLIFAAVPIFAQTGETIDPARTLFETGAKQETAGNLDGAKTAFLVLASVYHGDPYAERAKSELAAICLFNEAEFEVRGGKLKDGYSTYRQVMRIFEASPLAKLADDRAKSLGIPPDPRR